MLKHEYLACMDIREKLKEKVIGKIYITINNDTLTVNINPGRGLHYTRNINGIPKKLNIDYMVDEIEYGYRRFINENFFIKKEVKFYEN